MVNDQNIIVHDLLQLSTLLNQKKHSEWKLEIAKLTHNENVTFERTIKKYHGACGCSLGAAAMLLSGISYIAFLYLGDLHKTDRIALEILFGFILILGSVGLGKSFGIFTARRKLKRYLYVLRRKIDTPRPENIPSMDKLVPLWKPLQTSR